MKKYSQNFERDFTWFIKMRHTFDFDGTDQYYNKKGQNLIQFNKNGVDGKEAFFQWDSNGIIVKTKHPNLLHTLLKVKGGCNLHIKMYAEDRASCELNLFEFKELCEQFNAPQWFFNAVENQKMKYWKLV